MTVLTKTTSEVLDFTADISADLGVDTISTSTWTATGGVVVDSDTNTSTTATVVLSGGVKGTTCEAVNTAVSVGGKTHTSTITIRVL